MSVKRRLLFQIGTEAEVFENNVRRIYDGLEWGM